MMYIQWSIVSDIARHFVERWNDARFNRRDNGLVAVGTSSFISDKKSKKKKNDKNIKNNIMIELQSKNYDSEDEKDLKLDDINNLSHLNTINTNSNISSSTTNSKNIILLSDDELPINDQSFDSDDGSFEAKKTRNEKHGRRFRRLTIFDSMKNKVKDKYTDYKNKHIKNKKMKLNQKAFLTDENQIIDQTIEMDFKIQA